MNTIFTVLVVFLLFLGGPASAEESADVEKVSIVSLVCVGCPNPMLLEVNSLIAAPAVTWLLFTLRDKVGAQGTIELSISNGTACVVVRQTPGQAPGQYTNVSMGEKCVKEKPRKESY